VEYLYGQNKNVITQLELDKRLQEGDESLKGLKNVVMIQCVGSREGKRNYCARVCCNQAIRNARALRNLNPDINVTILYREIRAYGMHELNYRNERQHGVNFINFDVERKPVVSDTDGLSVSVFSPAIGSEVSMPADLVGIGSLNRRKC
jgi:heterodisulfide reductase subunit A